MEIEGMPGWLLRNFYGKENVMKKSFREQSMDKVVTQVSQCAGWLLITSKDSLVNTLLVTGKRMHRLFLKVRNKQIMQLIVEAALNQQLNKATGIREPVQFILRVGYLKTYPGPVSLRRLPGRFVRI